MTHKKTDRVMALAGLLQACSLVEQVARKGSVPEERLKTAIRSIFITDPKNVLEVYGDLFSLHTGLRLLRSLLERERDVVRSDAVRYAFTIIHLEKRVRRDQKMLAAIGEGINRTQEQLTHFGATHENIIGNLAGVYLDTVSTLPTRVQVNGEPGHLQNVTSANTIRACLLAALRSAILWRQVGGRRWDLVFSRKLIAIVVTELLKSNIRG